MTNNFCLFGNVAGMRVGILCNVKVYLGVNMRTVGKYLLTTSLFLFVGFCFQNCSKINFGQATNESESLLNQENVNTDNHSQPEVEQTGNVEYTQAASFMVFESALSLSSDGYQLVDLESSSDESQTLQSQDGYTLAVGLDAYLGDEKNDHIMHLSRTE